MKTYCYIRDNELIVTSDTLITKHIAPVSEMVDDNLVVVKEAILGVEGMVYDSVIETTITDRVEYKDGKIIKYIEPYLEVVIDPKAEAIAYIQSTPTSELLPVEFEFTDKEIGEIITDKVFDSNTNSQLASLMQGQVATLQLLVGINPAFKLIIKTNLADLITQLEEISKVRVATGLSAIDLSFLE